MAKGVTKPVYFNPKVPKELELLVWCEDKFSGFSGLVKDLLYREMLREKGMISVQPIQQVENVMTSNTQCIECNDNQYNIDEFIDSSDVDDYDC